MPTQIASTTVLTSNDVANQLTAAGTAGTPRGIDALGLVVPALGTVWGSSTPGVGDVDATTLRLALIAVRAPFTGTWEPTAAPVTCSSPDGAPIPTPAGVLALHPEALHRLETLVRTRLGSLDRPVPAKMLVHGVPPTTGQTAEWLRGGELVGASAEVSFHDRRGLIIHPLAVASLLADLLAWHPTLAGSGSTDPATGAGGVASIAGLGSPTTTLHVVDPHGRAWTRRRAGSEVQVLTSGGALAREVAASGVEVLAPGEQVGRATPTPDQVLWGPSPGGELGTTAWSPPPLPGGAGAPVLRHQFFRLVAVDLQWHLLGNRAFAPADPVPAEDDMPANAPLPPVRRTVPGFDFLIDGNDVLGAAGAAFAAWPASADRLGLLCSPRIDPTLALPPAPGTASHWPTFPTYAAALPAWPGDAAVQSYDATGAGAPTASWATPVTGPQRDVILTFPPGGLPKGTHVRAYPRTFHVIEGIGADPSFVRGDGGSLVVGGFDGSRSGDSLLLVNPFGLDALEPVPAPARLSVDVVAVGRGGARRMLSGLTLTVTSQSTWNDNAADFGGVVPAVVAALLAGQGFTAAAPVSAFGIAPTLPPVPMPSPTADLLVWLRWLANEGSWPRQGPHLPTQARFDTVLSLGAVTAPSTTYAWTGVLTGARWEQESRSASPELGDPGNPPGPDAHLTGVVAQGQLAYDLAFHAMKRCQSVVPVTPTTGWLLTTAGDNWNEPAADPAPAAGLPHMAAAVLETIAATTDSPELSLFPVPSESDTVDALGDTIATALGIDPNAITLSVHNEPRLRHQLQREIATAKRGQRDAMWSLARAVSEAREYVLIESPMFSRTARPDGTHPETHLVDLVSLLHDRLVANPRLKVMICLPRLPDVDPARATWTRRAFAERTAALQQLTSVTAGGMRVAAFHPIGFPGRPTVGRSTVVLVDDVYALVGTSHWRRRGMTFDGGCDVVSLDRRLDDRGASRAVTRFRQELLASRLGVAVPASAASSTSMWTRLAEPESAYDVLVDLLRTGGQGHCTPVWAGPQDTTVIPEAVDTVDPNGLLGLSPGALLGGMVP
ncbi:MAG: hypothetical protein ABIN79_04425 [Marmoricola sp.]